MLYKACVIKSVLQIKNGSKYFMDDNQCGEVLCNVIYAGKPVNLGRVLENMGYNTENERLHAKSYLFFRKTGFHTGYIGSSNLSRSALTSGLEWNLKITTKEIGHIIDKFEKTFETYWQDNEFETFIPGTHTEKLQTALN